MNSGEEQLFQLKKQKLKLEAELQTVKDEFDRCGPKRVIDSNCHLYPMLTHSFTHSPTYTYTQIHTNANTNRTLSTVQSSEKRIQDGNATVSRQLQVVRTRLREYGEAWLTGSSLALQEVLRTEVGYFSNTPGATSMSS